MSTLTRDFDEHERLQAQPPALRQCDKNYSSIRPLVVRRGLRQTAFFAFASICFLHSGIATAGDADCYIDRALWWDSRGNFDQGIANYTRAICICPNSEVAYNNRGYDWYRKGEFDKAIADYNHALAICPKDGAAYSNRGIVWDDRGEEDKALADYEQALAVDPNTASAYNNRGVIETHHGEYGKASADYNRALSVDPNFVAAYENLGFQQATCPDPKYRNGKKAFENASKGYQLDNGADPYSSSNALAAAYAECVDFAKAQSWQEKVVALAPAKDKPMQTSRLELYQQKQPYRGKEKVAEIN